MQICGIDDAGRGSMLGPLVISGISIDKKNLRKLSSLGVKDSKKLSPKNRELLYKKIIAVVDDYYIAKIQPRSIDASVKRHGLNELEAKYMAKVVSKLDPDTSYVDSCDVNPTRFGKEISKLSDNHNIKSYHHADSRFVVVSAASIIAKVTRDRAIEKLRKNHEPQNPKTPMSSCVKKLNFVPIHQTKHEPSISTSDESVCSCAHFGRQF